MAQHGYLREWDEGWDRDDDRERSDRDWRGREPGDRERSDRDWREASEHNRSFMFGGRDQAERGRSGRDQGGVGGRNDWGRAPRGFSANPDDHYRSWRDRQMQALDRDYEDYCREREQQFHQDFDSWRRNRQGRQQSGQSDELLLGTERQVGTQHGMDTDPAMEPQSTVDADSAATMGQGDAEIAPPGRDRARL
ncbi:MAG: hypothetical protein ACJ8FT_06855 [Sphingomonas sp.]